MLATDVRPANSTTSVSTVKERGAVDTVATIENALQKRGARKKGAEVLFLCPVHQDEHASAQWNPEKKVWKCYACGAGGGWVNLAEHLDIPVPRRQRITLADLAVDKDLPIAFLRGLGLGDIPNEGVSIPYRDGAVVQVKKRTALKAKDGSYWPKHQPLMVYGLEWWSAAVRSHGYGMLVEGESDVWSARHHDLPCLGIPGADTTRVIQAEHVASVRRLYVLKEPDKGGQTFVAGVRKRLAELRWPGEAFVLTCGSAKDLNDLHRLSCENFAPALDERVAEATALTPNLEHLEHLEHLESQRGHTDGHLENGRLLEHLEHPDMGPRRQRLSEIEPERIRWLWRKYLPLGKHSELMGDPGLGKSIASTDIAARLTSGRAMPDGSMPELDGPCGVVFMAAEDDPADTIRPRFDAAGGCAQLVEILHWAGDDPEHAHIPSVGDLELIAEAVADLKAKLLIVDPLTAHLPDGINMNRDNEVRRALSPLIAFLRRAGCASLAVRHLNKDAAMTAIYRGAGSIGLTGLARASFLVAPDPDDPKGERRVMAPGKINLGPKPDALPYELVTSLSGEPMVRWGKPRADITAANLLGATVESEEDRSALDDAKTVLTDILAAGALPSDIVKREGQAAGVSYATLRRAKDVLGVKAVKDGPTGGWLWESPRPKMLKVLKISSRQDAQHPITNHIQDVQGAQHAQTGV